MQTSDETFIMQGASSNGDIVVLRPLDYDLGPRTYDLNITTTVRMLLVYRKFQTDYLYDYDV